MLASRYALFPVLRLLLLLTLLLAGLLPATPTPTYAATDCAAQTDIPQVECEALVAFFQTIDNLDKPVYDWNVTNAPCTWHGITCEGGHVSRIEIIEPFINFNGEIVPELGNLTHLKVLHIAFFQLNGVIPPELGNLTNLEILYLHNNQLRGPIPPQLGKLTNLTDLLLHNNRLRGSIPPELGNLTNLISLSLSDNELSGPIPPELDNLTNLTTLNIENNALSGPIPPELGNLTNLISLSLSDNGLSGRIPAELGNLTSLTNLHLAKNELTGPIPPELGNLINLGYLSLNSNELSGAIPPEFGNFIAMISLHMEDNQLSGAIPLNFRGRGYIKYNYLDVDVTDKDLIAWLNSHFPDWRLQYGASGHITGIVQSSNNTPLPDITVAAYTRHAQRLFAVTTTDSDGNYHLENVPSNVPIAVRFFAPHYIYASEWYNDATDLNSTSFQAVTAITTTSNVDNINATLEEAVTPLAYATTTGSVTTNPKSGAVTVGIDSSVDNTITITYTPPCLANSVFLRFMDVGVWQTYPMKRVENTRTTEPPNTINPYPTASTYKATIRPSSIEGDLLVDITCALHEVEFVIGRVVQYEPLNRITDVVTGTPVASAQVMLYTLPDWEPKTSATDDRTNTCHTIDTRPGSTWEDLPPARSLDASQGIPAPASLFVIEPDLNPQMTTRDGRYGWDVGWGCWYVEVHAEGYIPQVSPVVGGFSKVIDLDLALTPIGPGTQSGRTLYLPMIQR